MNIRTVQEYREQGMCCTAIGNHLQNKTSFKTILLGCTLSSWDSKTFWALRQVMKTIFNIKDLNNAQSHIL